MKHGQFLVFDDVITSSSTTYTSASLYDRLGAFDEVGVVAVIDNVSGTNVGFDLFIEHSCDTRNWFARNEVAQASPPTETAGAGDITFNATNTPQLNSNTTYMRMFSDPCTGLSKYAVSGNTIGGPLLPYVRFAMKLTAGTAHVKVYAVQRDF